jgi:hypothetical protein
VKHFLSVAIVALLIKSALEDTLAICFDKKWPLCLKKWRPGETNYLSLNKTFYNAIQAELDQSSLINEKIKLILAIDPKIKPCSMTDKNQDPCFQNLAWWIAEG